MPTSLLATAADGNGAAAGEATGEAADQATNLIDSARDIDWQGLLQEYGIPALGALAVLIIGWIIAGIVGRMAAGGLRKARVDETLCRFLGKLVCWGILIMVVLACVGMFGVNVTSFAAVIAAAGFAVGLAFQGTLSSFSAGAMLLIFRPFKVGDYVTVDGQSGTVSEIDLFMTLLDTPDNKRVIIPNSSVFGNVIENYSYHPKRRCDVAVGTSYDADIDQTREVLLAAANAMEHKLDDPAPMVMLLEMSASSINWSVRVWVPSAQFWPTRDALTREIKYRLDEAGIVIPYPQMDVYFPKGMGSAAPG